MASIRNAMKLLRETAKSRGDGDLAFDREAVRAIVETKPRNLIHALVDVYKAAKAQKNG